MVIDVEIKQYNDGMLFGKLHSKHFEEPFVFNEFADMIIMMEIIFDTKGFPERQLLPRTFNTRQGDGSYGSSGPGDGSNPSNGEFAGASLATNYIAEEPSPCLNFELAVRFRRNAEWQGTMLCKETGVTSSFSSIVELARLINEAFITKL